MIEDIFSVELQAWDSGCTWVFGRPRYIVGQVRLDGEKRALTVAAIFPLEVSEAEARQLHSAEMAHAGGLQLPKGTKQKADTLML